MKAKITIKQSYLISIDGCPISGEFQIIGEWEGMLLLQSTGPHESLIVECPEPPNNKFDLIPRMFGGNRKNDEPVTFEAEIVRPPRSLLMAGSLTFPS